ncbi:MAG: hypothetical protein KBB78_03175 [Candidatus Pacebacteria bacterium]|nr:hypothetical protein [Candidatus Paceibacterota bacterium]
MNISSEQTVCDLKDHGYAFMPINIDMYEGAESAARIFLLSKVDCWQDWYFERKDKTKLGIIEEFSSHARAFGERHLALSYAHDLPSQRVAGYGNLHTKTCLAVINELYRDMRRRVSCLSPSLERHCGTRNVVNRIRNTFEMGNERATSLLLRSSVCGQRGMKGKVLQADSVLSMYFASEDSEIWLKDEATEKWELCSPPYGSALLFFGLKVGELGNPAFKSSTYRIDEHAGKSVRGTIMHVQIKEEVDTQDVSSNTQPLMA